LPFSSFVVGFYLPSFRPLISSFLLIFGLISMFIYLISMGV